MNRYLLRLIVVLPLVISCQKGISIKEVDDVCTMMDDLVFMKYCYDSFDINHDGMVSMSEAHAVKSIDVSSKGISSLKGIEFFDELTSLECTKNNLASLNISNNTQLKELRCSSNQLTSLDVSKNTQLKELYCASNQLSSLNLTKNTHLQTVFCGGNALTSLNVSKMTDLYSLSCTDNQITSLDVSKNPLLNTLFCSVNQLKSLDISKNLQLNHFRCSANQISSLDLSHNTQLVTLVFSHNRIETIDISFCPNAIRGSTFFGSQNDEIIIKITDKKDYWSSLPSDNVSTNGRIQWIWK